MKYDTETINYINKNINLLDYVSQYIDLKKRKGEWWCKCPLPSHMNDDNPSFSVNVEKNVYSCFGCKSSGTPIVFVQQYHKLSFPQAIEHLISYAKLTITPREYSDILEFLHKTNIKVKEKKIIERTYLPQNIMKQYLKEPIVEWLNEDISQEIIDKYCVRYDKYGNRIVFPIQDISGNIIAIKGRTRYENYRDLGTVKYIYYQPIGTNDFLFGLDKNIQNIINKKECLIVESEKSVMKLDTWEFNNSVATCTSNMTEQQLNLLLSLQCDLVFAFDKDIEEKKLIKEIRKLALFTNVYYVYDKEELLKSKDAPVDQGKEIWEKLYGDRYKI